MAFTSAGGVVARVHLNTMKAFYQFTFRLPAHVSFFPVSLNQPLFTQDVKRFE